ncbi:hypothetical protein [Nitrosococcus watsonii]|uniref:Uncharacterized protein n=1 Tax=Nitrosococcus watsoni (strain C-113) TaxID=105559 RepID=D8K8S4_NITWC|nr:hypothetical protein [Nitrosococcus watsonii]ADJ27134.1 hypothetical protein Nwat_0160 [Nitrosococcus watsonii C-113]
MTTMIQTPYLVNPIEDFHQITLDLDFGGGAGRIICDPNACSIGPFGDRQICTMMAPESADITLIPLRIADPTGRGRQLYSIAGDPLRNELNLVSPPGDTGDFRLIYIQRNGQRRVVSTEPVFNPIPGHGDDDLVCSPLARKFDDTIAQADLRPGFVSNTWILTVAGKKPNLNTIVKIRPLIYIRQPEYWGFDILDCRRGDIVLPNVAPYTESLDVTSYLGTCGVEVFWADESQRIDISKA